MADLDDVDVAVEILLETIEDVIDGLRQEGANVLAKGDYETARHIIEEAKSVEGFWEKVKQLKEEWREGFGLAGSAIGKGQQVSSARRVRGPRTPEEEYRQPILEALEELGGRAPVGEVLDVVYSKVRNKLTDYDLQNLASGDQRWRKAAQWCRYSMAKEGLLNPNSPHGIWEISDRGRAALARLKEQSN